jgi:general secretion pathway protein G
MNYKAFTLIELLIVVAIIGILAAIAVPNFLHAQIRAKVARCQADMQAIVTGLESYRTDNSNYPTFLTSGSTYNFILHPLTTPISYIAVVPKDIFAREASADYFDVNGTYFRGDGIDVRDYLYTFIDPQSQPYHAFFRKYGEWVLWGHGPDFCRQSNPDLIYDPSNGLTSQGDITYSQKEGVHHTSVSNVNAGNVPYPRGRCGSGTSQP